MIIYENKQTNIKSLFSKKIVNSIQIKYTYQVTVTYKDFL